MDKKKSFFSAKVFLFYVWLIYLNVNTAPWEWRVLIKGRYDFLFRWISIRRKYDKFTGFEWFILFSLGRDNEIDTGIYDLDKTLIHSPNSLLSTILSYYILCCYGSISTFFTLYNKKEDKFIHGFYHIFCKIILVIILWPSCSLEIWYISRRRKLVSLCLVGMFFEWKGLEKYFFFKWKYN